MNTLRLLELKFVLTAVKAFAPVGPLGNKLRGALGKSICDTFCNKPEPKCDGCPRQPGCLYGSVYKNPMKTDDYPSSPAPFVIDAPWISTGSQIKAGDKLDFSVTLFGNAVIWWREITEAAVTAFEKNTQVFNSSFRLDRAVSVLDNAIIYDSKKYISEPKPAVWNDELKLSDNELSVFIKFISPVMLKDSETYMPEFASFMDAAFFRIASTIDIYEKSVFTAPYALFYRKPNIKTERVQREGLIDGVIFTGKLSRYLPYIEIASHLHIGKQSTAGYGKFEYETII